MGEAGARRREADEDEHGGDEIARIVQRVGAERMARGHARHMGQRAPAHEVDGDREQDRADGEGIDVDRARRRRGCARPPATATPIESAARKPVSASAATASILAWPNG